MGPLNLSSPTQISILLFGGWAEQECEIKILNELGIQATYKTGVKRGQTKTKKGKKKVYIKGFGLKPLPATETTKEGIYQTNEAVLSILAKKEDSEAGQFAKRMLELRGKEKMLNTYYEGFEQDIYPDGRIHGNINHVSTITGRTSSTKPNLQNIPRD